MHIKIKQKRLYLPKPRITDTPVCISLLSAVKLLMNKYTGVIFLFCFALFSFQTKDGCTDWHHTIVNVSLCLVPPVRSRAAPRFQCAKAVAVEMEAGAPEWLVLKLSTPFGRISP